jgi:ATP-dependent DNA ligase
MLFRPSPSKKRPGLIEPCFPTLALLPPTGPQWVHEIKHDGYRLIARKTDGRVRLFTRHQVVVDEVHLGACQPGDPS